MLIQSYQVIVSQSYTFIFNLEVIKIMNGQLIFPVFNVSHHYKRGTHHKRIDIDSNKIVCVVLDVELIDIEFECQWNLNTVKLNVKK